MQEKGPPKGLIGLQLSLCAEVGTAPQKGREMRVVMGRPSHPPGDKGAGVTSSRWTEGPFPLTQKSRGDEAD